MLSALERILMKMGKGVGDLKGMKVGDVPGKVGGIAKEQAMKTGAAMKANPRAAVGGGLAGAAGYGAADAMLGDDEEEILRQLLEAEGY